MPGPVEPDAALMLRVKEGDAAAFSQLVDKYKQPVVNLVSRMLHDPTEAEDIAQNTFVLAYRSAHRYTASAKFSTWLFTIARNLCLNELRRRSRHAVESIDAPMRGGDESSVQPVARQDLAAENPAETVLHEELELKIQEALAQLPENQRLALVLCRQEDVSYDEIAKVLGCSLSAAKSLIHRGRETLKQRLKPYLRSGEWTV